MSYDDIKNRNIAVSVGVQTAAALAGHTEDPFAAFHGNVDGVVERVIELQAVHAIQDAFAGTTTISPEVGKPFVYTATLEQPTQAPSSPIPSQPAAIPGAADGDPATAAAWIQFFQNPDDFFDNRGNKLNQNSPDFRHKKDKALTGLWVQSKKNPSWVAAQLASTGRG